MADATFEMRRRILSFWHDACGSPVTLHMHERTSCRSELAAVDAAQSLLHVRSLATSVEQIDENQIIRSIHGASWGKGLSD